MKKILLSFLLFALLAVCSCNTEPTTDIEIPIETVSLSSEEMELIEAIGSDLEIVTESDYADTVTEMVYHTDSFMGRVFQIEGIYSSELNEDSTPYIYRKLINNGVETVCGLPLAYMEKDIPDDSWVRAFGIINKDNTGRTIFEIIAIESLAEDGQRTLEWNGGLHNH